MVQSLFHKFRKIVLNASCTLLAQLCVCLAAAEPVIVFQSNQLVVVTHAVMAQLFCLIQSMYL